MIATVGFCWLMTLLGIGPRILISRYFYHNSTARHANWTDILCSLNGPERFRHWDLTAPHLPSLKASIQHDPENLSWAAGQNGTNCANIWNGREIFPVRHAHPHGHCCTHPAAPQGLLSWEAGREKPGNSQEKTLHQPRTTAPTPRRVPSSRTEFRVALRQSAVLPGAAQTVTGSAWTRTGSPDCSQAHLDAGLGQAVNDTVHHVLSLNDLGQRTQVSAQLNSIYGLLGFWLQNFERYREKLQLKPARHTLLPD